MNDVRHNSLCDAVRLCKEKFYTKLGNDLFSNRNTKYDHFSQEGNKNFSNWNLFCSIDQKMENLSRVKKDVDNAKEYIEIYFDTLLNEADNDRIEFVHRLAVACKYQRKYRSLHQSISSALERFSF